MRRIAILLPLVLLLLPATARAGACNEMKRMLVRGGGAASGLFVIDAESGKRLCGRSAKAQRPLASNTKLFTTAAALARFGARYRIPTRLLSAAAIDGRGVLRGDLYLRGAGDPTLGSPAFQKRFTGGFGANLFALKAQLRGAGVRAVKGRLYADDSVFDRLRGVADSGYATSPYIGPLSGLAFNLGYGNSRGSYFAADPATLAASKLAQSLRKAGISIRGVARRPTPAAAEPLATVRSPTMSQLVEATNLPSNNFYAEMLVKLLGARFGGAGTTAAGTRVVERFARGRGAAIRAVDGSGLTRGNRASPAQVVRLLQGMRATAVGDQFIQDLALTGVEGTVDDRTHGTAAYRRCRTKTGTLTGVSALSGYCFNRSGRVMIFSILMSSVTNLSRAHDQQDQIAGLIASY